MTQSNDNKIIIESQVSSTNWISIQIALIILYVLILSGLILFIIKRDYILVLLSVLLLIFLIFLYPLFHICNEYQMLGIKLFSDRIEIYGIEIPTDIINTIHWIWLDKAEKDSIIILSLQQNNKKDIYLDQLPQIRNHKEINNELSKFNININSIDKKNAKREMSELMKIKSGTIQLKKSEELVRLYNKINSNRIYKRLLNLNGFKSMD